MSEETGKAKRYYTVTYIGDDNKFVEKVVRAESVTKAVNHIAFDLFKFAGRLATQDELVRLASGGVLEAE